MCISSVLSRAWDITQNDIKHQKKGKAIVSFPELQFDEMWWCTKKNLLKNLSDCIQRFSTPCSPLAYWEADAQGARSSSAFNINCYRRGNNGIVKTLTPFNLFIDSLLKGTKKRVMQVGVGFRELSKFTHKCLQDLSLSQTGYKVRKRS